MVTRNPHLNEEQLAALTEGGLGEVETATLESHLLQCRECMAAYADLIRIRGEWVRGTDLRTADPALRELGYRQLPLSVTPHKEEGPAADSSEETARGNSDRSSPRWLVAAIVPLLVVGLGWFGLSDTWQQDPTHPAQRLVSAAVHEASHSGMILPGCGSASWSPGDTFRAAGEIRPDLNEALITLGVQGEDRAAQLLRAEGLLAAGRLDLARLLTDNTLRVLPEDTSWQHLAAVVAFRENNLARAEILLRGVLVTEPQNIEAQFNLGLVLAAGGQNVEARRIFSEVSRSTDYPLAQRRATVELGWLAK